jgi:hypothetical protein
LPEVHVLNRFAVDGPGGFYYQAQPGTVEGFGGRGVEGPAFSSRGGYLFHDASGDAWWIIFHRSSDVVLHRAASRGDVLACSASEGSEGEPVRVRVLAEGVLEADAEDAFRVRVPATFEDAVRVAACIAARTA